MMKYVFISAVILISVYGCSRVQEKIEQKVGEKIDQTIDKGLEKIDSTFRSINIDTLKNKIDSLANNK